jgi:NitT/TauT family transport system ATP-binding protein
LIGKEGAERPDPLQAAWLYAQMVRWGQAPLSLSLLEAAKATFRPDLYDASFTEPPPRSRLEPIGAFSGPPFGGEDIGAYLEAFAIRWGRQA